MKIETILDEITADLRAKNEAEIVDFFEPFEPEIREINFDFLDNRYPHLHSLSLYFQRISALSKLRPDRQISFPSPLLLIGPPGIGKTDFCITLADDLAIENRLFDCAASSAGWMLTGLDSGWRGGKPGIVSDLVSASHAGAGWLILDEIDKADTRAQFSIFDSITALLESKTARIFRDEFHDTVVDASQLNVIATANNINEIPGHIIDRFEIIECRPPTEEQRFSVLKSVAESVKEELYADDFEFETSVFSALKSITSLREIKRIFAHAIALTAQENSTTIDAKTALKAAEIITNNAIVEKRAGFIL